MRTCSAWRSSDKLSRARHALPPRARAALLTPRARAYPQILVGTYCKFTNQGGIVHPGTPVEDLDELSSLLQVRYAASRCQMAASTLRCAALCDALLRSAVHTRDWLPADD